jgi:hypothetical protein
MGKDFEIDLTATVRTAFGDNSIPAGTISAADEPAHFHCSSPP